MAFETYDRLPDADFESHHVSAPSAKPVFSSANKNVVHLKVKFRNRYREFDVPYDFPLGQLQGAITEKLDILSEVGAHVQTAYLLWLMFGWMGAHRWYLKQHNATSFAIWLLTGQFFGIGWLLDGIFLASNVAKYNKRTLYKKPGDVVGTESGLGHVLFGFYDDSRPSMLAAYLLWFFFGWCGVHRWYTGHHTPSSFFAWLFTFQICGLGYLYDIVHTAHMVNYPRTSYQHIPFYLKALKKYDYVPVNTDEELSAEIQNALATPDATLRLLVVEEKRDDTAYLLWLFFGVLGAHAAYLDMGLLFVRFFTGNFFFFGWIVDGINLQEEINRANKKIEGDFVPALKGRAMWPWNVGVIAVESFETV